MRGDRPEKGSWRKEFKKVPLSQRTVPLALGHTMDDDRKVANLRWPRLVGQLGGLFKMYSYCHSYRQNLLGQIFLSLLLRL